MKYRPLGPTGVRVSVLSLGSWLTFGRTLDEERAARVVALAFERGVNLFDTADVYARGAAEELLGRALRPLRRQDYVLASKAYFPMSRGVNDRGLSRKHLFESVEGSLRRLGTDYLDLYQCHRHDPDTPVEEVVRAMDDLVRQGKILYWGTSLWPAVRIAQACERADRLGAARPVTNQPPLSLIDRRVEEEVVPICLEYGLRQIVYSPLGQGILTGKYVDGEIPEGSRAADEIAGSFVRPLLTQRNLTIARRVRELAGECGVTPAQLSLAWVLSRPGVSSAIVGVSDPDQLDENLAAADWEPPPEVLAELDRISAPA